MERRLIDLRAATDEEIAAFVFDRPVAADLTHAWWWGGELDDVEVAVDPRRIVRFLTRLFRDPESLLAPFSAGQIDQGFWYLLDGAAEPRFGKSLWDVEVPWPERAACIAALPSLYSGLWVPLGCRDPGADHGAAFMLPDWLAFGYDCANRSRDNVEDRRVQDALLSAFRAMLRASDAGTHKAGLHGIFHLVHPEGSAAVREFLDANPGLDPDLRAYAENGLAGRWL